MNILGHCPWWTGHGVYVASLGTEYAEATGQPREHALALFSGVSYCIAAFYNIWGNLASSLIFQDYYESLSKPVVNSSTLGRLCGRHFCPGQTTGTNLIQPSEFTINLLIMSFIGLLFVAFMAFMLFVDNTNLSDEERNDTTMKTTFKTILNLLRDYRMFLLLPAVFYIPFQSLLMVTEYTQVHKF